jgi:hypothetical protein
MGAHGFTLPPIEGTDHSTDLSALFEAQKVLGQVLADASAGRPNSFPLERVFDAAGYVFCAIHRALLDEAGEGSILTRQQRRDVYEGLEQARRSVEEVDRNARAKRYRLLWPASSLVQQLRQRLRNRLRRLVVEVQPLLPRLPEEARRTPGPRGNNEAPSR